MNNDHPKSASSSVSSNGVKINILTYDDKEYDEDHDINYEDYFQAIADVDNLNLENAPNPSSIQDDYVYFNDDIIDQFFTFDIPQDVPRPLDLPGVGSRNPVPLSDFPRYDSKYTFNSNKFWHVISKSGHKIPRWYLILRRYLRLKNALLHRWRGRRVKNTQKSDLLNGIE